MLTKSKINKHEIDQSPTILYKQYQQVENDYVAGLIEPSELKNSIYTVLGKKKKKTWKKN